MNFRRQRLRWMVGWLMWAGVTSAGAVDLPEGFTDDIVFRDLEAPTAVDFTPDGRVFVSEKSGLIKTFASLSATTPTVAADLRTAVHNAEDRGLIGIKLHPSFPAKPYLYATYALDAAIGGTPPRWGTPGESSDPCPETGCVGAGRLSRLQIGSDGRVTSEKVLIENWCQAFGSHSVGGITFDGDGVLYVAAGDGASALDVDYGQLGNPANACGDPPGPVGQVPQASATLAGALRSQSFAAATGGQATYDGKILRVDPLTGTALQDNPLSSSAVPGANRIIASGLREPFRLAIRPGTHEVWVGDVGWGAWEEIDRVRDPVGGVANFGWPCFEGPEVGGAYAALNVDACDALYGAPQPDEPFFTYAHGEAVIPGDMCDTAGAAITGLTFYAGPSFPASYRGALFFSDYARSCIWVMQPGDDGLPNPSTVRTFAGGAPSPIDLHVGPQGDLYYVDVIGGTVHRIRYTGGNLPPEATISADVVSGPVPLVVHFDASASRDPEGGLLTFQWDLNGDGTSDAVGPSAQFTYRQQGTTRVSVMVSDARGATARAEVSITAGNNQPPIATLLSPSSDLQWRVGDTITFEGTATDPEDGLLPASAFGWSLLLHHCPHDGCHIHFLRDFNEVRSGSITAVEHEYPCHLELQMKVTDSDGATTTQSVLLYPQTSELTVESIPSGLNLSVGSESESTPFSQTFVAGSRTTVTATTPQQRGCREYEFVSWSDGGARSHQMDVAAATNTVTANFVSRSTDCPVVCPGDCNADRAVQVDELVTSVAIAVGMQDVAVCRNADMNSDQSVTVDEILAAVTAALDGCDDSTR